LLRPEIAQAFPTSDAVNEALQSLINVANRTANLTTRSERDAPQAERLHAHLNATLVIPQQHFPLDIPYII
jgi:hypothetical protein